MAKLPKKKNNIDIPQYIYELSEEEKEFFLWYRVQKDNVKDSLREKIEKEIIK